MTHRKYTMLFIALWTSLLLTNFIIWKTCTERLLSNRYEGGDMTRVGYIIGSKLIRKTFIDLPKRHIEITNFRGQKIDVLTIGDSFSAGGGFGRNSYYQDYIASKNGLTVLNAGPYPTDDLFGYFQPLSTLSVLYNSGYLDIIKPRYVLIESISRYAIKRFAKPFDFSRTDSLENVRAHYGKTSESKKAPSVFFFNNGNFKFIKNSILYRFSDTAFTNIVHVKELKAPLFSVNNSTSLLFFHEDLMYMQEVNKESIKLLNDNFNRAADLLEKKGIRLIFMPIVDKYDLYSDYIINNPYPKNIFFEELRKLPKKYKFIDTKELLSESLKNGEKDVYFPDDSHWNWKASKLIFESVEFD